MANKKNKYRFFSRRSIDDPESFELSMKCYYRGKYFNLWLNSAVINGLDDDIKDSQNEYFLRKLWDVGAVAMRKFDNYGVEFRTITQFAESEWDMYDKPTKVTLVNNRGVSPKIVPARVLEVGKEVALIYGQPNHKPIKEAVENCINRMVNLDMAIQTNLAHAGIGFIFVTDEENSERLDDIETQILSHEKVIKVSAEDVDKIKDLPMASEYLGPQLRAEKEAIESELLTYLGVDNAGSSEKAERMTVDEVNAGNDLINTNAEIMQKEIKRGIERYNHIFNDHLSITFNNKPVKAVTEKLGGPKNENAEEDKEESGND